MSRADGRFLNDKGEPLSYDEWEIDFFKYTVSYTVVVPHGKGDRTVYTFRTYLEALAAALHLDRSILYMVDKDNHDVCIPRNQWQKCLDEYNRLAGTKWKMPFKPKVNYERR